MATIRPISRGEQRDIRCSANSCLTPAQRAFASVSVEWFNGPAILQLVFGNLCFEMAEPLARDFGARIERAMRTRIASGARRSFRCAPGMTRDDRDYVEVIMQDDGSRSWLRLEFADGNTVDFSTPVGRDFADRIRRAMLSLPNAALAAAA